MPHRRLALPRSWTPILAVAALLVAATLTAGPLVVLPGLSLAFALLLASLRRTALIVLAASLAAAIGGVSIVDDHRTGPSPTGVHSGR